MECSVSVPTFTSREFHREPGRIKRATAAGPVIITEHGQPILAVLPFAAYERLKTPARNILDALDMDGIDDIDIDFSRSRTAPADRPD